MKPDITPRNARNPWIGPIFQHRYAGRVVFVQPASIRGPMLSRTISFGFCRYFQPIYGTITTHEHDFRL